MPYNPGGLFSLVASYFATPGATIRTEQHNPVFEDVASALSSVLLRDGRAPMIGPLNMNGQPINNVVAGNSPSSVATLAQAMPIGAVIDYALKTPPPGWLLCTGLVLLANTPYQTLRSALIADGFAYGQDGSGNPKIPDGKGCVTAGFDQMGGSPGGRLAGSFGAIIGSQTVTLSADQLAPHAHSGQTGDDTPDHTHTLPGIIGTGQFNVGGPLDRPVPINLVGNPITNGANQRHIHPFTTNGGNGVAGNPHSNVQPTLIMNKIIRVSYDV
ncbi:tail fiber protein [Tardiphaga sp. 367_B4_N1_1]|uniref:tail fiber protein n=1 Tax=Tardiphaga sp. 367_B4_N1_1 TaxID=3240777 RepID=UPI003F256171